jgi:hypothetical protein
MIVKPTLVTLSAQKFSLFDRGIFLIFLQEDAGDKVNIVPSRFVLPIEEMNGDGVLKAIFLLGGHQDCDKKKLVHSSTTLK